MDTTIDGILGCRVEIEQPAKGYRVAIDTVLLAAAVPTGADEIILDFGCGVGGAMLCLAARLPGVSITGIDIQEELVELCRKNIERNKLKAQLRAEQGDVTYLALTEFDHVIMNPPYHDEARHDVSKDEVKRVANTEKDGDLALWLQSAAKVLKDSGILTLIHRADRLDEILGHARNIFGAVEILPVMPKIDATPKRVILRVQKKGHGITYCSPIILYKADGGYTDAAESILRHAEALEFL